MYAKKNNIMLFAIFGGKSTPEFLRQKKWFTNQF